MFCSKKLQTIIFVAKIDKKLQSISFIATKIRHPEKGSFSALVSKITIAGIASGIFVMIITFAILVGFKKNIVDKIFSFGGHINIKKYDLNESYEEKPIVINPKFIQNCLKNENVKSIYPYSMKAALIKTNTAVHGIVIKGLDKNYDTSLFSKNIIHGKFINFLDTSYSKQVMISNKLANKLDLKISEEIFVYFVQNPPRVRKLKISAIFNTGMDEFDEHILIADINLIRKINQWPDTLSGGYEIFLNNMSAIDSTSKFIFNEMDYDLSLEKISDKFSYIFDWLHLLDQNVIIFLGLIIIVACFNMISSLIIIIMERTQTIGILKALGASDRFIIGVFYRNGIVLILKGLLYGNTLAIVFCAIQYYFKIIPLDPANYYMDSVPIAWDWTFFVFTNVFLFFITSLVLFVPTYSISKILPINAIKFS